MEIAKRTPVYWDRVDQAGHPAGKARVFDILQYPDHMILEFKLRGGWSRIDGQAIQRLLPMLSGKE